MPLTPPPTTGLSGRNEDGGFDYIVVFGSTTKRAKRDGRNPSTGAFAPNQTTGVVDDNIEVEHGFGGVHLNIKSYKSQNEIDDEVS